MITNKTFLDLLNRGDVFRWCNFKKENRMGEIAKKAHDKVIDLFFLALKENPGEQPW
jgi:hypothetical protein